MIEVLETPVVEPTTPIKPSDAIKIGRLIRPVEVTGFSFRGKVQACTIGALACGVVGHDYAINVFDGNIPYRDWYKALPEVIRQYLDSIPDWFDHKIKSEKQIIQELEEMGY